MKTFLDNEKKITFFSCSFLKHVWKYTVGDTLAIFIPTSTVFLAIVGFVSVRAMDQKDN